MMKRSSLPTLASTRCGRRRPTRSIVPRQWLTSGGLGTMGFGLPAAIGAALANPQRKVICFSGDGSLMMNIQEMATAAENQLDVKIILLNNEALGLVHQQQSLFYQQGVFAATYPGMINSFT
ncbi:thiamine pyrophosphate-dependent enzyme [Klebsiella pneumoniae]|nr:thiamine pyrophosphate-dependent enzyme [Klebsiella pneumoniae]